MRKVAVSMMGVLRAGILGVVGFLFGYLNGHYPLALLLEAVGIVLGLMIEIAEEAARSNPHLSPSMRLLSIIGGLRVLIGGTLGAYVSSLVSHSTMVVLLAAGTGGIIAVLIELADRFNGGGFFLGILRTIYEGAVGALGGYSIGLLILFQTYTPQWISVSAGSSHAGIGTWLGSAIATSLVAWLLIAFIPGSIALLGALLGLISGAIVAFTSPSRQGTNAVR
jgi:hypothetical protein